MASLYSSGTCGIYYPSASSTSSGWDDGVYSKNSIAENIICKNLYLQYPYEKKYKNIIYKNNYEIDATTATNGGWKYTTAGFATKLTTTANYVKWSGNYIISDPKIWSPSERMKEILRTRQGPAILGTRKPLPLRIDEREQRARETLRRLVGDEQFRRFLKHGFITIKAASGLTYQLFHGHTYTWQNGKRLQHLCVVLDGDFPPTDTLIVRYLMIMNNEQQFCQVAIKSDSPRILSSPKTIDMRPLMDVFQELKAAA